MLRNMIAALLTCAACPLWAQAPAALPYLDPALPAHARAVDLVGRMTLPEKVSQMTNTAAAVPRLHVPAYDYWSEALHGVARAGYATMFPQAIGMAASFDPALMHQIGDVIATEARAKNNEALRHDNHRIYFGLTFWSPNINIFRDPRWGRGQETYGEDPFLSGTLGTAFVRGLQGDDPRYFKVIATPKHFAIHSGPESDRHRFNVEPSPHDLWDTYLPQFRAAIVDGKADSIMCAYNAVDHTPACASTFLLQDVLRKRWGFQGFVTSDCGAIDDFFMENTHRTEPDAEHADRDALRAGTDTSCGRTYGQLGEAVRAGLVQESEIDRSLVRLMEARIRLGLFDPPERVPYTTIPFREVHSAEHVAVARRAAQESIVLLKNDGVLPLDPKRSLRMAVIGPNAAALDSLEGNYNGTPHAPLLPVDAVVKAMPHAAVTYAAGAPYVDGFALPIPRTLVRSGANGAVGWHAEYFDHPSFDGKPIQISTDPEIDFDWNDINPLHAAQTSGFAVRWTGTLVLPAGQHALHVVTGTCENCADTQHFRLRVDGREVAASAQSQDVSVDFAQKQQHTFQIEFVRDSAEHGSGIALQFTPGVDQLLPEALQAARNSDLVVAMLGLSPRLEGEEMRVKLPGFAGGDRTDIALPASQERLLQALLNTGKPVVVVLLNGSAVAVNLADQKAAAVVEAWYPGEAGSQAIADVLTGTVNPSGRLPVTFYRATADLPAFADYSMANRTYRYFKGDPLYRFGFGLSYTQFRYSKVTLAQRDVQAGQSLEATAEVTNTGKRPGDEVAELYLLPPASANGSLSPRLRLAALERVSLRLGETKQVRFVLDPRALSEVDRDGKRAVLPGNYGLAIGGAQPGDPKAPAGAPVQQFTIRGTSPIPD